MTNHEVKVSLSISCHIAESGTQLSVIQRYAPCLGWEVVPFDRDPDPNNLWSMGAAQPKVH
jgi:hypothetical protein